LPKKTKITVS